MEKLGELTSLMNFPWILTNVLDAETGHPLNGCELWHVMDIQGVKVGFVGLVEQEWLNTISKYPVLFTLKTLDMNII